MTLSLSHQLECSVCGQAITFERQVDTKNKRVLFGAMRYAICPCCSQEVDDSTFHAPKYRRAVDRFIEKRRREHEPHVDHFYDTHLKMWTVIKKDAQGNQIGDATYCTRDQLKRELRDAHVELFNHFKLHNGG